MTLNYDLYNEFSRYDFKMSVSQGWEDRLTWNERGAKQ